MKRINQFLLSLVMAITCISFVACGDDDENNDFNTSDIVGKWKRIDNDNEGYYLVYTFTSNGRFDDCEYYNGTPAEHETPQGEWDHYEIKKDIIYVTTDESSDDWEENENNTTRAKIIKLTATELVLQWEDPDDNGEMYWNDIYTFQKITE